MGNLPDDLSDMELAEYFCELGQVLSAQIRGNDGAHFGFVEFAYPEHVQHVLSLADQQPFMMGDSYLRVQPRRAKEHRQVHLECRMCSFRGVVLHFQSLRSLSNNGTGQHLVTCFYRDTL